MSANNAVVVILPGVVVAVGALVVFLVDLFVARKAVLAWIAAAGLIAGAAVAVGQWISVSNGLHFNRREPQTGFAGMVSLDKYTLFCVVLFAGIGVATIMLSDAYLARRKAARGEFYGLLMLVITGMIGMVVSTDIVAFFVSFELMSLPTYVLAGYLWRDERSGEASIKYFVTGAFSSAILAFGLALVYGATGQTTYAGIAASLGKLSGLDARGFLVVAFVLVVTGFGFKISAVPFHNWAPDVYEGAPTPVTAFMAVGVKAAAFAGFAKLFVVAAGLEWQTWTHTMTILAVLTMVVGNVLALPQRNLKRMLAYSSIAHAGYLTLGLIAAGKSGHSLGVGAILFYLAAYALMNLGAFGVLIWIRNRRKFAYTLGEMGGLGRTMPWAAILMAVFMVSLTGIPPTVGFWGKFYLFTAVIQANLTWLAIVAVIMSSVSAYYYLRVVWYMYFREAPEGAEVEAEPASSQLGVTVAVSLAAAGVLVVGLFAELLRRLAGFREERAVDFVIANGENAANGAGITSKIALKLLGAGVDVITTGNHVWRQKEVYGFLTTDERIVRPANYPAGSPGRGVTVRPAGGGGEVAVINLAGELFMNTGMSPFRIVDRLVDEAEALADAIVVDLHAEATSEKVAMGHYLDGRVTAVLGTHTHVQTSDARVLPGGTAYMTDVGMTGPLESVIGVRTDIIVRRFLTELPAQFEVADGPVRLDAALIAAEGGRATAIEAFELIL